MIWTLSLMRLLLASEASHEARAMSAPYPNRLVPGQGNALMGRHLAGKKRRAQKAFKSHVVVVNARDLVTYAFREYERAGGTK
jgi:hypothetical protein